MNPAETPPIIDAHHHLWDIDAHDYPWLRPGRPSIVGDTSAIRRNYLAGDFLADSVGLNLVGTVHLDGGFDPRDPVGETRFADAAHRAHGFPNAIVGAVDLAAPEAPALIEAHQAASSLFRGVRQILAWHQNPRLSYGVRRDLMDDPAWRRGFARLGPAGLSFDLQVFPGQMHDAARLARDFPDTQIILNQAGMPDGLIDGDLRAWRAGMARLAELPNVSAKVSGLAMLKPDWTLAELRHVMEVTVEAFGADRVMLGSNFPVDRLFRGYREIFDGYLTVTGGYSAAERMAILSGTAARIYRPAALSPLHERNLTA